MKEKIKNILIKKYNNIFALCLTTVLAVLFPSFVRAYNVCPGGKCSLQDLNSYTDANGATGDGGICGNVDYCFQNTEYGTNELKGFDLFTDKNGNILGAYATNATDREYLERMGIDNIYDASSLPFWPDGSLDEASKAESWANAIQSMQDDFVKHNKDGTPTINPNSEQYKVGVKLGLYTGDVKEDTINLLNGKISTINVEKGVYMQLNGQQVLLTTSNVNDVCAGKINNPNSEAGSYCRAVRDSNGSLTDKGEYECITSGPGNGCIQRVMLEQGVGESEAQGACCMEAHPGGDASAPGGACCEYFNSKEYCEGGNGDDDGPDDDDDDVPKDYEWNYEMCPASSPVTPVYLSPRTPNTPVNTGGSCGGTATSIEYDYSQTMCEGLVILEQQTTTTISLRGLDDTIYYAGNSFSWKKSGGTRAVDTRIFDTSALQNKISEVQTKIVNHENKISQLECTIKNIEKTSSSDSCKNLEGIAHEQCVKAIDSKKEETIKSIQIQLEQLKNDSEYLNARSDLEKYNQCSVAASNYVSTHTSNAATVSVNSEYISFEGIDKTYKKGEIVGVMKNSGEPLTRISEEISNGDNYLSILSDYYVPVSIKNGTRGLAQRSVSSGNASATYTCQFSVANNFRCTGDDCEKGLNIIYRPISLSNPFPSANSKDKYRTFGSNWSEMFAEKYIINNRNVKEYDVYNLKPLYTITLTPSTIKSIRNYNKKHSMNDFNLSCTEGYDCISKFLWEEYNNIIDTSNSCATANGLDEECYRGGAS